MSSLRHILSSSSIFHLYILPTLPYGSPHFHVILLPFTRSFLISSSKMAFRKMLAMRLFNVSKISSPNSLRNCRISSPSTAVKSLSNVKNENIVHDHGDDGIFRRFLHGRTTGSSVDSVYSVTAGEKLLEKLRGLGISKERISLDGLKPPALMEVEEVKEAGGLEVKAVDARKLLKLSQLEMVKSKLRQVEKSCIKYDEFVDLCCTTSFGHDQGMEMAKLLDQTGTVIVLGDFVFIRPEQVMKAIQGLMPLPVANPRMIAELEQMEKQKAAIDRKAESLVRRELQCGLGFLVIQVAAFMRLTFWELTWDVMEPICFYLTSMYFMAGYAFFLRTSKEPTFEGFFKSRFSTKQMQLMKLKNFDLDKYNQLRRACYPDTFPVKDNPTLMPKNFGGLHSHVVT